MTKQALQALAAYHQTQAEHLFLSAKVMAEPEASSCHARAHQHLEWHEGLTELLAAFNTLGTVLSQ